MYSRPGGKARVCTVDNVLPVPVSFLNSVPAPALLLSMEERTVMETLGQPTPSTARQSVPRRMSTGIVGTLILKPVSRRVE